MVWSSFGALVFGARAVYFIWPMHSILRPDTSEFARHVQCWSSPVACGFGYLDAYQGERLLGAIGGIAFGAVIGYYIGARRYPALWMVAAFCLPFSLYTCQASADALGAALVLVYLERRPTRPLYLLVPVALVHLVAGLVGGVVVVCRKLGIYRDGWSITYGCMLACLGEHDLQLRYFVPAMALVIAGDPVWQSSSIETGTVIITSEVDIGGE